jgi:YihY family inner membrane protein
MSKPESGLRRIGIAFVEAVRSMWNHEVPRDAAAISYFSLFILFPAVLVLFAIVDAFLGMWQMHGLVVQKVLELFPGSKAFLEKNLSEIRFPSPVLFLSSFIVVIWGSTWIFTLVENALNRIWGVPRHRTFWESRIRSIGLLVLGGTLLLISAGITLVWSALSSAEPAFKRDQVINSLGQSILLGTGLLIAVTVFFCIYKLMPDRRVPWFEAFSGAVVATTLWEADWCIFVRLVPVFNSQNVYGTMGAVIALLTWVYTSSLIMLFGASFTAKLHNTGLEPEAVGHTSIPAARVPWHKNVRTFPRVRR